ncbi:rod shape-determining protein MreC [Diplocloster agilis]|uniref:Cell shape-determining protein MreC n=1 Tax=Diplocloster agilis TaxID=2850323 RepID=A0A949JUG6_9FIRM|nr:MULTISPECIES: rod shape-determining protein MreC [Lachnospiraceae]MBU9735338.1 rod shape-determining protein MreC [Diplocloster agilis]MBU9743380.1 rod shape-determining protein MreC [Diplocloster agilis]MCU6733932.1 rod shape-determining protein MreC [Suonthocola fibrivorans]SCJ15719.1 rod shape-determining protein MreC [uncultured Clostridium sp.]
MRKRKKFSIPSKYLLLFLTLLCIGLMLLTFTTDMATGPLRTVSNYVFVPIQKGINQIGWWISDKKENLADLKEVRAKNQELQQQVDELTAENTILQQDKFELERLRELVKLDSEYSDYQKVGARIIGKDPGNWFDKFLIDKGTNDGLAVDMNVIAGGGLVGIITEVGPDYATVRSIIDDTTNVSAMIETTSDRCIVQGNLQLMNDGIIQFSELSDKENKVNVGDKVVTSIISSKYLPRILIGYVKEINPDANNLTKSGTITPVVDFEHLEEVLVITDLK